jgi:hypothetical protein
MSCSDTPLVSESPDRHLAEIGRDLLVFVLLVAIGACGRWAQPDWCFTPIAAVTIFAGYYFARWPIAILVPVACLAISDLALPAYDQLGVLTVTYAAMVLPVWLGRSLRQESHPAGTAVRWICCGLLPAAIFFLTTNFAVWLFKSHYEKTLGGLTECYLAAVPFFRTMLVGDVFYLVVIFGCLALARLPAGQRALSAVRANPKS